MNIRAKKLRLISVIGIASLPALPVHAGLSLNAVTMSPYQVGFDSMLRLGLTVIAGTNMPRLHAGGSFDAHCFGADTGYIRAGRNLSSTVLLSYNRLTVTIPEWLPAYRDMPGFESVDRGRTIQCTFDWEAHAEESTLTVGVPGGPSMTIGGEKADTHDSEPFTMRKSGTATGEDDACIP